MSPGDPTADQPLTDRGAGGHSGLEIGKRGELKSKRAEPGENSNESARGTLGKEKELHFSPSPSTEGASVEERGLGRVVESV